MQTLAVSGDQFPRKVAWHVSKDRSSSTKCCYAKSWETNFFSLAATQWRAWCCGLPTWCSESVPAVVEKLFLEKYFLILWLRLSGVEWCIFCNETFIFKWWRYYRSGLPKWHQRWRIRWPVQEAWETRVQVLACEDPLEEEITAHSSILAYWIPWTGEPGGLQSLVLKRSDLAHMHWSSK